MENKLNYTLVLDESGQFIEREGSTLPAIVAGYLVKDVDVSPLWANDLFVSAKNMDCRKFSSIEVNMFHAMEDTTDIKRSYIVSLLETMAKKGIQFIVFQNEKGLNIHKPELTYLNVFTEGVVSLIRELLLKNQDVKIHLKVLFAGRTDISKLKENGVEKYIDSEEYLDRLEEKVAYNFSKISQEEKKRFSYTLVMGNARRNKEIMLADAICFAFRGGLNYFADDLRLRIDKLEKLVFKVNKYEKWELVTDYLISGRIADAVYAWYTDYDDKDLMKYEKLFEENIVKALHNIGPRGCELQYNILSFMIGALIDDRKYALADKFLSNLTKDFFKLLKDNEFVSYRFFFDIRFWELTIATHEGATIRSQDIINECRRILKKCTIATENLDYFINYKIREVEHWKNVFAFEIAIDELNKLEKIQNEIVTVLANLNEEEHGGINIHSDTLAKIWGSRTLARAYYIKNEPSIYDIAKKDSDNAINQFNSFVDKARQFQVRSYLESESGHYALAYKALMSAFDIKITDVKWSPDKLVAKIWNIDKETGRKDIFGLMHYTNLMAKAKGSVIKADIELADDMYNALQDEKYGLLKDIKNLGTQYPLFIVQWHIATYLALNGDDCRNKAAGFYEAAQKGMELHKNNLTNYASYAAMLAERIVLLRPQNKNFERYISLITEVLDVLKDPISPETIRSYFKDWDIDVFNEIYRPDATGDKAVKKVIDWYKAIPIL